MIHPHRMVAIAVIALALGCSGKKRKPEPKPDNPADHGVIDFGKNTSPGGLGLLSGLLSKTQDRRGPYDEPDASADYQAHLPHYAVLELSGGVVERKTFSLLGGSSGTALADIARRLDQLAANEKVLGLIVRAGNLETDMATAEELRELLVDFKTARGRKRPVHCHTEGLMNVSYYVFSACDRIGLAPTGQIVLSGAAAMPLHIKGLLDKLGIRADFLHVGAFKGAAEPLTRDEPSPAMRQTLGAILDQSYTTLIEGVASGRRLPVDKVKQLVDVAVFQDQQAVAAKLADRIGVFETFREGAVAGKPWTRVKLSESGATGLAKLMEMIGMAPHPRPTEPHVAVVYAVGGVVDGHGGTGVRGGSVIASRPVAAALRALAADDKVKAIVLRISSGGGSALASEIIWNAVAAAKQRKPVIVSMAGVAASGGYYIGCGATKIYALRNTLTGSIGVVGGKLAIAGAADKLGIKGFPLKRGKRALMWSAFDPWSTDERATVQQMMEGIYKTFVQRVAAGRGKTYDQVHAIAQGRVWTGAAAKANGLIDELGGLHAAIAEARKLGKVGPNVDLEIYPPAPTLFDYLSSFGVSAGVQARIEAVLADLDPATAKTAGGLIDQLLMFRDTRVMATMMLPVVFR